MNNIPQNVLDKIEDNAGSAYYKAHNPKSYDDRVKAAIFGYQLRDDEVKEQDAIIYGLQEGADNWKLEYDNCRTILELLVKLKEIKDSGVITDFYLQAKPKAWEAAKEFLLKYQHH